MPLFITSLNSGSNGNCYYIGNGTEAVLIDAGISCREIEIRMKRLALSMSTIKAIFVSHEHADHISGITTLSKKYQIPVYITATTLSYSKIIIQKHLICSFKANKPVQIGGLSVLPFQKFHDASDPHSFMVFGDEINIAVITDIGFGCKEVIRHFKKSHAVFLEANYCEDMLENGNYPYLLKGRISGENGHLSNTQALEIFLKHKGKNLSHLILSHLSKNNNSPTLVKRLFKDHAGNVKVIVASRYKETPIYAIDRFSQSLSKKKYNRTSQQQLSLF